MKIKIFTLSIILSSCFLYSSDTTQPRNITWQSKNSGILWQVQDAAYRKILTTRTEEKKSREQIRIMYDIALLSIKFQGTLKKIENIEQAMHELSKILTSIEKIIAERSVIKK